MATVRRYSRSARVVTEVQPNYQPAEAKQAEMFGQIKQGFDAGVKFLRPAVEQEQTIKGEKQANEDFEADEFEMRSPFSIRDQAYNASGDRLFTNRAMIDLDEGFRGALQRADGNMQRLEQELNQLKGTAGELPEIPGLATRWNESFERGVATARRQTTELAQRRAAAAARQAAADAAAAAAAETERLAFTAGTPEDLAAAITSGVDNLAQFGPRGEFEVNGVVYPADPNRQGTLTPRQIQNQATALSNNAHELFLRADYQRSDDPSAWAAEFQDQVLSGNSPLPPGQSLTLASQFERAARSDESARITAENRVAAQLDEGLSVYIDNGIAIPDELRVDMREQVAGNPRLSEQLETTFVAADTVADLNGMNPTQRVAYIEQVRSRAMDDGVINVEEAAQINALQPLLTAAQRAFTRETTGVSAAEQAINSGAMLSDEALGEIIQNANASGNQALIEGAAVLSEATDLMRSSERMTGVQREEWLNGLESTIAELTAAGATAGTGVERQLRAIEMAMEHVETLSELAEKDPTRLAATMGVELEEFPSPETATLPDVANTIVARVAQGSDTWAQYGNDQAVPLSQAEIEGVSDWMRDTNNASRIAFVERLNAGLPAGHATKVMEALGADNPELLAAGRVAQSNAPASRAILSGIGVTVGGVTPTNIAQAELAVRPVLAQGWLPQSEMARISETAQAYAKGMAARENATEITLDDLEKGYDIALGADAEGVGGIEDVGSYGTTILPTGISGADLEDALYDLGDDGLQAIAGGSVTDAAGREMTARQLFGGFLGGGDVVGLQPLPGGLYAPIDREGGFFMTANGPLTFAMEDVFTDED